MQRRGAEVSYSERISSMKNTYNKIKEYIEEHRQEMTSLWERLVNIDSGTANADGVRKVCSLLQSEMAAIGMQTKVIESGLAGPVLVGEWNKSSESEPIVLIGHMDTVFGDGTAKTSPFRIDTQGNAHGPGVLDMKAGLVIALYAVKALQTVGFDRHPVKCVFAGDEENLHMLSNAKDILLKEMEGAAAAFNFETGYLDDGLVVGRKGGGIVEMTVHGISSHSGIAPEKGRSAILEMAYKVIKLEGENDLERGKLINCGEIKGGIGSNTIPDKCKVTMSIRFPSVEIRDEILEDIRKAAEDTYIEGTHTQVDIKAVMECMESTDGVLELFEHVRKTARECGYGKVHPFTVGGVSDSGISVTNGIPTVCAMGVRGQGNHTAEEFAVVESLYSRTVLAASAIYTL